MGAVIGTVLLVVLCAGLAWVWREQRGRQERQEQKRARAATSPSPAVDDETATDPAQDVWRAGAGGFGPGGL